jgi:hypothetical protein
MAFVVKDRVKVSSTTTGTGTLTLGVAPSGFQDFSVIGNGNTTSYAIVDNNTGAWEVGIGTYTASGTLLSRDTVLESSTGGAKVSFAAGAKDVFVTYPAETSVTDLGVSRPTIRPSLLLDFANTEALDPRITFARASTARYYNGVTTAKAEENLFTRSQEFDDAAWFKTNIAAAANTGDTTAPDGTSTAEKLTSNAGSAQHYLQRSTGLVSVINGLTYAFSVFVKAGTETVVQLAAGNAPAFGTNAFVNFDLTAGTTGTVGSAASNASIVAVGNDWYRISFTCPAIANNANGNFLLGFTNNNTTAGRIPTFNAAGTEDFYAWGAQLEQRDAVTAYTPTTTAPITNYVPVLLSAANNVARFDHNPVTGESLGLLIEELRSNLILQSEDFSTTWAATRSTVATNQVVAPSGALTADILQDSTDNDTHFVSQSVTTTAVAITFSVYAKAAGRNFVTLTINDSGNVARTTFYNLSTGAVGTTGTGITASVVSVGNGWYRCIATVGTALAGSNPCVIGTASADNTASYAGNGFSGVAIWGAQVE